MYGEMRERLIIFEEGPRSYVHDFDLFFRKKCMI